VWGGNEAKVIKKNFPLRILNAIKAVKVTPLFYATYKGDSTYWRAF